MTPTRTDAIVKAVAEEAEKQRTALEGGDPPQVVAILVYLSRSGKPVSVAWEPKWRRDLEDRR